MEDFYLLNMFGIPFANLVNFTQFAWEHDLSVKTDSTEKLHHTLIGILLLEAAVIYFLISTLFRNFNRDEEFPLFIARSFRFSAITILDTCAVIVHQRIVNEETSLQYPLRFDGLLLMYLNLWLLIFLP